MLARWLPLVWVITFVGVGFVWRAWFHYRRFGHSGFVLFRSGVWTQHMRDVLLMSMSVVIGAQAVAYAVAPSSLAPLAVVPPPTAGGWLGLGTLLLFGGIVLMVAAQLQLGASWRVGIDEQARPGLMTSGLYRFTRNPIYLALFVALAGLVVVLPTWLTLAVVAASVAGIHSAVRAEERYLRRAYGEAFESYARRVGRFVPGLGTLPNGSRLRLAGRRAAP
jgi:protein-S-isoprenylcysteine O-methyltransferase Ste14